jgi:hypothetical protein
MVLTSFPVETSCHRTELCTDSSDGGESQKRQLTDGQISDQESGDENGNVACEGRTFEGDV